jgi:hypothetical protein
MFDCELVKILLELPIVAAPLLLWFCLEKHQPKLAVMSRQPSPHPLF